MAREREYGTYAGGETEMRHGTFRCWVGMVVVAVLLFGTTAVNAEEVTLRAVSAFQRDTTFSRSFESFIEWINEHGEGVLQINYIGGPEVIPPFEVGHAISTGVIDIANVTAAYYTGRMPLMDALKLATNTIQEQRKNGCYELIDRLHRKRMNVKYLARTGDHIKFHLYLTQPIDSPDLSGLTIRTTPVYQAFFEALGANLVRTPPGEVYTALQRGTIQGYGWPTEGIFDLGWAEPTNYRVDPGFYQVDVEFLVNLDTWKSLTDEQRALLKQGAEWVEARNSLNIERSKQAKARQVEAGIKTIEFTGDEREKWLETAHSAGWKAIKEIDAELARKLRACLTGY